MSFAISICTLNLFDGVEIAGRAEKIGGSIRPLLTFDGGPGQSMWTVCFRSAEQLDETIRVMQEMREKMK